MAPLSKTELIHEVWLTSLSKGGWQIRDQGHFYALASLAMRRVLVDLARKRLPFRRGAGGDPPDRPGPPGNRRDRRSNGAPRSQGPRRRPHGGYALLQRLHAGRNRPGDRTHRPPGALPLGERYEVAQEDAAVRSLTSGAANEPAARGLLPGSNSSAVASISMDSSENRTSRPLPSPRTRSGRSSAASGSRSLSWRPVSISNTSFARL